MLKRSQITKLFHLLNDELSLKDVKGEVGICGGAVMYLVFKSRPSTKDVDGIFEPTKKIREAAKKVAVKESLDEDWLNDAAKVFLTADLPKVPVLELSHLRVWAAQPDYMLAMKCLSARFDTRDKDDVIFLIRHLDFKSAKQVFGLIERYYPRRQILPKTRCFIEEVMERYAGID